MPRPDTPRIYYGEFGQSFIELVVTPERIDEAMTAATAKPFPPDVSRAGPGDLVTATATGKVGRVTVTPVKERLPDVAFLTRLDIGLTLVVHAAGVDTEFDGLASAAIHMHVQTHEPLTIFLEVEPITDQDVRLTLQARNRGGTS